MGIPSTVPATILTFFRVKCDTCVKIPARCYNIPRCVATNVNEKHEKSWNEPETVVTLHQKSEMISVLTTSVSALTESPKRANNKNKKRIKK